jgi:hypothetical protein
MITIKCCNKPMVCLYYRHKIVQIECLECGKSYKDVDIPDYIDKSQYQKYIEMRYNDEMSKL